MTDTRTEQITDAAIMFQDLHYPDAPTIMCGERHADIFERMFKMSIQYVKEDCIQGFWTNWNRFLTRYAAKKLALENGQLKEDTGMAELYSEDLW